MTVTNTDRILKAMFARLLQMEIEPAVSEKLVTVIDGVMERLQSNLDLATVQGQNTFRALVCSMIVHGWGMGMHPHNNPNRNLDGEPLEVKVSRDILVPLEDLQSLRYVKKDAQGRVKKALFEPDQNARIRQNIDQILADISRHKWEE
jgi:hypothetical protein